MKTSYTAREPHGSITGSTASADLL